MVSHYSPPWVVFGIIAGCVDAIRFHHKNQPHLFHQLFYLDCHGMKIDTSAFLVRSFQISVCESFNVFILEMNKVATNLGCSTFSFTLLGITGV